MYGGALPPRNVGPDDTRRWGKTEGKMRRTTDWLLPGECGTLGPKQVRKQYRRIRFAGPANLDGGHERGDRCGRILRDVCVEIGCAGPPHRAGLLWAGSPRRSTRRPAGQQASGERGVLKTEPARGAPASLLGDQALRLGDPGGLPGQPAPEPPLLARSAVGGPAAVRRVPLLRHVRSAQSRVEAGCSGEAMLPPERPGDRGAVSRPLILCGSRRWSDRTGPDGAGGVTARSLGRSSVGGVAAAALPTVTPREEKWLRTSLIPLPFLPGRGERRGARPAPAVGKSGGYPPCQQECAATWLRTSLIPRPSLPDRGERRERAPPSRGREGGRRVKSGSWGLSAREGSKHPLPAVGKGAGG